MEIAECKTEMQMEVGYRVRVDKVEVDLFIPKLNIGIEYDGSFFHQGNEHKDLQKNEFLQKRNVKVIRVRCRPLSKISEIDLIVENDDLSKTDLNRILKKIYFFVGKELSKK